MNSRGFTFVELVIVIVIIGILSYVTYVKLGDSTTTIKIEAAARKMVSDIRYAQELAMTIGEETRFYVDVQNNRYYLKWSDGTYVKTPMANSDYVISFAQNDFLGVEITATNLTAGRLDFNSLGSPLNAGVPLTADVVVATLNNVKSVKVRPRTGNAYLSP